MAEEFLVINTDKAIKELEKVEEKRKEVEKGSVETIKKVDEEQMKAFNKAVNAMQGTWHAAETILRTLGISVPQVMRTIISGAFGAIKTITMLLTAAELTPGMQIQATIGLMQIGFSIAAAIAAQRQQKIAEETFNDVNTLMGTVSSLIGAWSY